MNKKKLLMKNKLIKEFELKQLLIIIIDLIKVPTGKRNTYKYPLCISRLCNIQFIQLQPILIRPTYV